MPRSLKREDDAARRTDETIARRSKEVEKTRKEDLRRALHSTAQRRRLGIPLDGLHPSGEFDDQDLYWPSPPPGRLMWVSE